MMTTLLLSLRAHYLKSIFVEHHHKTSLLTMFGDDICVNFVSELFCFIILHPLLLLDHWENKRWEAAYYLCFGVSV